MPAFEKVYDFFVRMKSGTEYLAYGRPVLRDWMAAHLQGVVGLPKALDLGCGQGEDLLLLKAALKKECELFGVEGYGPYREACEAKGIKTLALNIERDVLPFADASFDAVLINQVLEHAKEHFFIFSEVSRILKPGGLFLVGVPNLAAWHDRLLLLLGWQPSGIKVLGPHIRGFTVPGFSRFAECDGYFKLEDWKGGGFFPFPAWMATGLAKAFPSLATAVFFKLRRTEKPGTFIEALRRRMFETNYWAGPG